MSREAGAGSGSGERGRVIEVIPLHLPMYLRGKVHPEYGVVPPNGKNASTVGTIQKIESSCLVFRGIIQHTGYQNTI